MPAETLNEGEKAPAFALKDESGKIVRLSDFQGKPVVLLVDKKAKASLGEGIFGGDNRWNMMFSGEVREHPDLYKVFHDAGEAVQYLQENYAPKSVA